MPGPRRRPTTHDVAKAAGVSAATVSYVLNDTPGRRIGAETRDRVQTAADALGYRPQLAGRTLRMGRSNVVALILPEWPIGTGLSAVLEGLARELSPNGYSLALVPTSAAEHVVAHVAQSLAPAAIIVFDPEEAPERVPHNVPLMIGIADMPGTFAGARYDFQKRMAAMQIRYLVERGHTRIGYARSNNEHLRLFVTARAEGAMQAAAECGIPDLEFFDMNASLDDATEALHHFRSQGVTAIAAYNDETALPLIGAAQRHGIAVPADIAIIGLDGMPSGEFSYPALTTIHQDSTVMTRQWTEHVLALINEEPTPSLEMMGLAELIERESV